MMETFADVGLYGGTFLVCFIAGLVPFINAEAYLVITALAVSSAAPLPAVVFLAALGQMVAKVLLYFAAMGVLELPFGKHREKIEKARAKIDKWKDRPKWILLASSLFGLPPFYVISLIAGALKIRLRTFCAIGMAGRLVRFAVIVAIPFWL